jgi:hypothetical protein
MRALGDYTPGAGNAFSIAFFWSKNNDEGETQTDSTVGRTGLCGEVRSGIYGRDREAGGGGYLAEVQAAAGWPVGLGDGRPGERLYTGNDPLPNFRVSR